VEDRPSGPADPFVAGWVGDLLASLESADAPTRARVFDACARRCTAQWASVAAEVRVSLGEAADVDTLLARFASRLPGGADLSRRGDEVVWRFTGPDCPCPVARVAACPSLCECSVAHVRGMLEPLLGQRLDVRLLRSRLRGADDCLFVARARATPG
jgi:hypothetical protein